MKTAQIVMEEEMLKGSHCGKPAIPHPVSLWLETLHLHKKLTSRHFLYHF
jgi:hypothetical protein